MKWKQLRSRNIAGKFQSVVHRGLYLKLKEQLRELKEECQSTAREYEPLRDEIEKQRRLVTEKENECDELKRAHKKLERQFNSQLSYISDLESQSESVYDMDHMVKSLQGDKENLQMVNQRLKQQVHVFKFQSAANQKLAKSMKHQKHSLKSKVFDLLEEHAPDEIKQILSENVKPKNSKQNKHRQPLSPILSPLSSPMQCAMMRIQNEANQLPPFSIDLGGTKLNDLRSPLKSPMKSPQKQYQREIEKLTSDIKQHRNVESQVIDRNNTLMTQMDQLRDENKILRQNSKAMKKRNSKMRRLCRKLVSQLRAMKSEIRDIRGTFKSTTHSIYWDTAQSIDAMMEGYDRKLETLQRSETKVDILQSEMDRLDKDKQSLEETVTKLGDKNDMITAYMKLYKEKIGNAQKAERELAEAIREKEHRIATLEKHLKFKEDVIEELRENAIEEIEALTMQRDDFQQKHEVMLTQCVSMSKMQESLQIENNRLMDAHLAHRDRYIEATKQLQTLKSDLESEREQKETLCTSLFQRHLAAACYRLKLQQSKQTLDRERDTVAQLKKEKDTLLDTIYELQYRIETQATTQNSTVEDSELVKQRDNLMVAILQLSEQLRDGAIASDIPTQANTEETAVNDMELVKQRDNLMVTALQLSEMLRGAPTTSDIPTQVNIEDTAVGDSDLVQQRDNLLVTVLQLLEQLRGGATTSDAPAIPESNLDQEALVSNLAKLIHEFMENDQNAKAENEYQIEGLVRERDHWRENAATLEAQMQYMLTSQDEQRSEMEGLVKERNNLLVAVLNLNMQMKVLKETNQQMEEGMSTLQRKCEEMESTKEDLQSDLTGEQLKSLQLNDQIGELEKIRDDVQADQTGMMLKSLADTDTIHLLVAENELLRASQVKQVEDRRIQTHEEYCNDPTHQETIDALQRKFSLMCLNMEKVQRETAEYVENAVTLRDENIRLKKQHRRNKREMKQLQHQVMELKRVQKTWSLGTSCRESTDSNREVYFDAEGNSFNVEDLKMMWTDSCVAIQDQQSMTIQQTETSMAQMNRRLDSFVERIKDFKMKQLTDQQADNGARNAMLQIVEFTESVTSEFTQRVDSIVALLDLRCDGVSRSVRLVKHALESKNNDETQIRLEAQNSMQHTMCNLQFAMKVLRDTFQHEMMGNIGHLLAGYQEEFEHFKSTIHRAFTLTLDKYNQSLEQKNSRIAELETLLYEETGKIELSNHHYNELNSAKEELHTLVTQLTTEKKEKDIEIEMLQSDNNELTNSVSELKGQLTQMANDHEKQTEEKTAEFEELTQARLSLQDMVKSLQQRLSKMEAKYDMCRCDERVHQNSIKKQEAQIEKLMQQLQDIEHQKHQLEQEKSLFQEEATMALEHKSNLVTQVELSKHQCQQLKSTNDRLQEQVNSLRVECDQYKAESSKLQGKLEYVVVNNENDSDERTKLSDQLREIETERDEYREKHNSLENELTVLNELVKELTAAKGETEDQLTKMQTAALMTKGEIERLSKEKQELTAAKAELQSVLDESNASRIQLVSKLEFATNQCTKLEAQCNKIAIELEGVKVESDQYRTETLELQQKLESNSEIHKSEIEHKQTRLDEITSERDELTAQLKASQTQISELQMKLNVCESDMDINAVKLDELEKVIAEQRTELKQVTKQRDRYGNDKKLLQGEMKLVHKQLDELNDSKAMLITQIEQLMDFQSNSDTLRIKMEQYTQMTACNQERIQQLEAMKATLENDNLSQSEGFMRLQTENRQRRQEMDQLLDRNTSLQEEITELLQEKEQIVKEGEELNERNQEQMCTINKLQEIIENNQSKLHGMYEDSAIIRSLEREKDKLSRLVDQQDSQILALREEMRSMESEKHQEIADLKAVNMALKQEMSHCETRIATLKQCIVRKNNDIQQKYGDKVDELERAINERVHIEGQKREFQSEAQLLLIEVQEKNERILELEGQITTNQQHQKKREQVLEDKLNTLKEVVLSKVDGWNAMSKEKDSEIQLMNQINKDIENERLIDQEENEMIRKSISRLQQEVDELNAALKASNYRHRMVKQLNETSCKTNARLQQTVDYLKEKVSHLQHDNACCKHETAQIHRHRDHIKEKCWTLEARLMRYKEKFAAASKECTLLRKKTTVLDQLLRLTENQTQQLQFDNKSGNVREKMLSDLMLKVNGQNGDPMECLYAAYESLAATLEHDVESEEDGVHQNGHIEKESDSVNLWMQRVDDLKAECDHYREIAMLNEQNQMDLKQQTALYTHQILENWHEMFDKLTSMINIKSYTVEILKKTVDDIINVNRNREETDYEKENASLNEQVEEMKGTIRKLEVKHRKEEIELRGLLDREVHLAHTQRDCMEREVALWRSKVQSFYSKYRRAKEQKEQNKLATFMDGMRHEMTQITQENTTMATVTNSLREIVREQEDKNESMYKDMQELLQYMQQISGETFLSEDEENMYSATNLGQLVSAVKQKALSISSSRSSLHRENEPRNEQENDSDSENGDEEDHVNEEEEYTMIDHDEDNLKEKVKECPICEQEFNQMVWKYKCVSCDQFHCAICAPIRSTSTRGKIRECHTCHHSSRQK